MDEVRNHEISLKNREKLFISDVKDVESFDEEKVVIETSMGTMTVFGANFRMHQLNVENGQLTVEGMVDEIKYSDQNPSAKNEGGLFSRLFR